MTPGRSGSLSSIGRLATLGEVLAVIGRDLSGVPGGQIEHGLPTSLHRGV